MKQTHLIQEPFPDIQEIEPQFSFTIMAALIGIPKTGKTFIFDSITANKKSSFLEVHRSREQTLTFAFEKGREVKIKLWHPVGQQKYNSIPKIYYRDINVFLLVFRMDDKKSFLALKDSIKVITENSQQYFLLFLLGTNMPERQQRANQSAVSEKQVDDFVKANNIRLYREINPMETSEVQNAFDQIAKTVKDQYWQRTGLYQQLNAKTLIESFHLSISEHKNSQIRKSKCC